MWVGWLFLFAAVTCVITSSVIASMTGFFMGTTPYPNAYDKKLVYIYMAAAAVFAIIGMALSAVSGINFYHG